MASANHNRYDILFRLPCHAANEIPTALELLAQQIVTSGRLRINADSARNFVHYSGSGFDKSFSYRELTDPNLLPVTRETIAATLPGGAGKEGVKAVYERLMRDTKTARNISLEREMQIARLLVQATHPVVIHLCLIEQVDLFVSYSHNVADLLAMHFWECIGQSGGLQAVSGDGTAVYVSCGGNPFIEDEEQKTFQSDGFPALARMQVIAAQELGHYADLKRNVHGQLISRHSSTLQPLRATPECAQARQNDLAQTQHWQFLINRTQIPALAQKESQLEFYRKNRKGSLHSWWLKAQIAWLKKQIREQAIDQDWYLVSHFPGHLHGSHGWATDLLACLQDMAFNLAPKADAYRRDNPKEEEAIACIEALARVPQQSAKWGPIATQQCWPNLFRIYEEEVIPANIASYEKLTGKNWYFPEEAAAKSGQKMIHKLLKLIR